jgi:hypothetical protein
MNGFFIAAAIAATGVTALHVFAGGRAIARPLLRARDIHPVARLTAYYCWHGVTIVLAGLAAAFGWAAFDARAWPVAALAAGLCLAFALLGLGLVRITRQKHRHMPQWLLFTGLTALAVPGLLT